MKDEHLCFACDHPHIGICLYEVPHPNIDDVDVPCSCLMFKPRIRVKLSTGVVADLPTVNGNIYPKAVLEKAVDAMKELVADRQLWGMLGMPSDGKNRITDVSHLVTDIQMDDSGTMLVEVEPMKTPNGRVLYELLSFGTSAVRIGMTGIGATQVNGDGFVEVSAGFKISSFDIVPVEPEQLT